MSESASEKQIPPQAKIPPTDVLPPVSFDISLGKTVDFIDVDQQALAARMSARGATPPEINESSIMFGPDDVTKEENVSGNYNPKTKHTNIAVPKPVMHPQAVRLKEVVTKVNDPSVSIALQIGSERVDTNDPNLLTRALAKDSEQASAMVSDTLDHEVEHRLHDIENGLAESREHQMTIVKRFGRKVLVLAGVVIGIQIAKQGIDQPLVGAGMSMASAGIAAYGMHKIRKAHDARAETDYLNDPAEIRAREAETNPNLVTIKYREQDPTANTPVAA